MKRIRSVISVAVVVATLTWVAIDVAGTDRDRVEAATQRAEPRRATRYYGVGPSAEYDFDSGSIGVVRPLRMTFASGSTHDLVVLISMDYRTSGDDPFVVAPLVRRDTRLGPVVDTRPGRRAVAPSTAPTSSTTAFVIEDLRGGHTYWFSPTVNVSRRVADRSSITSRHVVFVVDALRST
jgi:hypothetical protein